MSTVHISSDCTSVPLNTVKSKPKRANKRHTKKSKSKSNNQHVSPKTGPVTPDDDVIIVGTSTKTKHQTTKELEPKQRTSSQNEPAKNAIAPGTRKSYAEAIKNGAKSTTMQGLNKDSLHKTRKYFNIVDLCGILPYKRMCPHLCGRIIYNCISSPFLYYINTPGSKYRL